MKRFTVIFSAIFLLGMIPFLPAHAIKKCQDAEGKWHYGDVAVAQCKKSKVTTLNERGFIDSQKEAPKTAEQIQREKEKNAELEAELALKRAEEDERNRILSVYETEADIDRQRDNQINSVVGNIAVHKAYVKAVTAKIERLKSKGVGLSGYLKQHNLEQIADAEKRVEESTVELEKLVKQKEVIKRRFDNELKIYRELKNSNS